MSYFAYKKIPSAHVCRRIVKLNETKAKVTFASVYFIFEIPLSVSVVEYFIFRNIYHNTYFYVKMVREEKNHSLVYVLAAFRQVWLEQ